tara:strand:+ start:4281 stop:4742 length:462 start_codon:yes stop_codon:yes gene_type:complete
MKKRIILLLFLNPIITSAQEIVSTQGDSYSNTSTQIDFTIGEIIINTESDGINTLTQGFHQTNWNFVGLENHAPGYEATIFPNPTSKILNISTSAFENVTYTLYDAKGKLILQDKLTADETHIRVGQLAAGKYSLILNSKNQKLKTFKLVKTH